MYHSTIIPQVDGEDTSDLAEALVSTACCCSEAAKTLSPKPRTKTVKRLAKCWKSYSDLTQRHQNASLTYLPTMIHIMTVDFLYNYSEGCLKLQDDTSVYLAPIFHLKS